MKKNLKYSIVLTIILLFMFSTCIFAIDMNLANTNSSTNTNTDTNSITNEYNEYDEENDVYDEYDYLYSDDTYDDTVQQNNALPESSLGLGNILNIILIVVGVLLILLAIAILIRLKG